MVYGPNYIYGRTETDWYGTTVSVSHTAVVLQLQYLLYERVALNAGTARPLDEKPPTLTTLEIKQADRGLGMA